MRTFRVGLAAALAVLAVWTPAARTATPANRADLHKLALSLVKAGAPGAVVFVRSPSGVRSAASGAAVREPRVAMQASDDYRIASVTKTFVATIVLQLEAEGRLKVDDPVERWLPGLVPNGSSITLRELLNHTSGLFNYTDDEDFVREVLAAPGQEWAPHELLAVAFSHAALFAPGTNWSYSNTNYVLLGLVIEAVTGRRVEQEFRGRLFGPLGLAATSFPAGAVVDEQIAHGYARLPGGPLVDVTSALSPSWAWAAGGIVSNAADVSTFFAALLQGRLLPAAELDAMETGPSFSGAYGLGLAVTSTRCGTAYGHNGDFPGWRNVVWASKSGQRVAVVMINVDDSRVSWNRLDGVARNALCTG